MGRGGGEWNAVTPSWLDPDTPPPLKSLIHMEFILVNGVGCGWSSRSAVYIFECSNCQVCMIFVRKSHEDFEKILREWRSGGGKVN